MLKRLITKWNKLYKQSAFLLGFNIGKEIFDSEFDGGKVVGTETWYYLTFNLGWWQLIIGFRR